MKAKTAKTIILIIGVAIILSGFALFFLEQYWLKLPLLVLLLLLGVVVFVALEENLIFGLLCLGWVAPFKHCGIAMISIVATMVLYIAFLRLCPTGISSFNFCSVYLVSI